MKCFVNFNEYLGGGETLLLRLAESQVDECLVITSQNSYIENKLRTGDCQKVRLIPYPGNYNYSYLSNLEKNDFLDWLEAALLTYDEPIQFVTFCMRDLHVIAKLGQRAKSGKLSVVHLLLHPLDHLYLGQTLCDKVKQRLGLKAGFHFKDNIACNSDILKRLAAVDALIPMNSNVSNRLYEDTNIYLSEDCIVPLPFASNEFSSNELPPIDEAPFSDVKRIVWLGRIVDFKLPAILAMIDFIAENEGYIFDIIGYGKEAYLKRYINKKGVADRVDLVGLIPHDQLNQVLRDYHIGYGMGTSIIELTCNGLPSIVALGSPDFKLLPGKVCAGLVYEQKNGNVGDDLYCEGAKRKRFPMILEVINRLLDNRFETHRRSMQHIDREFSLRGNVKRYHQVIDNASPVDFEGLGEMQVSCVRKTVFRVLG